MAHDTTVMGGYKRKAETMARTVLLALSLVGIVTATAGAQTLLVDDDAPLGGDGQTWQTAHRFLTNAIAAASPGTEIRVAQGLYRPDRMEAFPDGTGNRFISFPLYNEVSILGGYAGIGAVDPSQRDPQTFLTVLSGDLDGDDDELLNYGDNSRHVVTASAVSSSAVLDGVTVTAGYASPGPDNAGGGLYVTFGSATISDCEFYRNVGANGGAVASVDSSPEIVDCRFRENLGAIGGALLNDAGGDLTLIGCSFRDNVATSSGGGAVASRENSLTSFVDCHFIGNSSDSDGGALLLLDSLVVCESCLFSSNHAEDVGGAIYADTVDLTLLGCTFNDCDSVEGGAVYQSGSLGLLTVTFCSFSLNSGASGAGALAVDTIPYSVLDSTFDDNVTGGNGGGVKISGADGRFERVEFRGNSATSNAGAINLYQAPLEIANCRFISNDAGRGGAIDVDPGSGNGHLCRVVSCSFYGNHSTSSAGAIYATRPDTLLELANCVLSGNSAGGDGGGLHLDGCSAAIVNCTVASNDAGSTGGGLLAEFSAAGAVMSLVNSIVHGNLDSEGNGESAQVRTIFDSPSVDYCCIEGLTGSLGGSGNTGLDPVFLDLDGPDDVSGTEDDDLRIDRTSPCVDAGDVTALPADGMDLDADGDPFEPLPLDFHGNPRRLDAPDVVDTGVGAAPIVDMGAAEFIDQLVYEVFIRGDGNSDGVIDVSDVIFGLEYQFLAGASTCLDSLDITDDGNIDLNDPMALLTYLFQWGNPPALPFPHCGLDPTSDGLNCVSALCP